MRCQNTFKFCLDTCTRDYSIVLNVILKKIDGMDQKEIRILLNVLTHANNIIIIIRLDESEHRKCTLYKCTVD